MQQMKSSINAMFERVHVINEITHTRGITAGLKRLNKVQLLSHITCYILHITCADIYYRQ